MSFASALCQVWIRPGRAHKDGALDVNAGQAVITRAGEWVQYSTPHSDGAEYKSLSSSSSGKAWGLQKDPRLLPTVRSLIGTESFGQSEESDVSKCGNVQV